MRFTLGGGKAITGSGTLVDVPFELWNIAQTHGDTSDDYRMIPVLDDLNGNFVFDLTDRDHSISGGTNDPQTDWFSWYDPADRSSGSAGYQSWVSSGGTTGLGLPVMNRFTLVNFNGGNVPGPYNQPLPPSGTVYRILTNRPNAASDVFSFVAPSVNRGREIERASARRVGVFPNPYYGGRGQETSAWRRFVTFNNLPPRVTIRIFNLAGHLVKILEKDNPSQFLEWDLTNADNWQVASGVYICYVEMPAIGETKVLKVAVIQPQLLPPTY
jgi:hypothetical protein